MDRATFTARVAETFTSRPGEWIDARELMTVGGTFTWRARVTDARRQYGLAIEKRTERVLTAEVRKFTRSLYRYVPGRLF